MSVPVVQISLAGNTAVQAELPAAVAPGSIRTEVVVNIFSILNTAGTTCFTVDIMYSYSRARVQQLYLLP